MRFLKFTILAILFFQVSCAENSGQKNDIAKKETELLNMYIQFEEHRYEYGGKRDTLLQEFEDSLTVLLKKERLGNNPLKKLDSLRNIAVIQSDDNKLTVISWDYLNNGTWHVHNSIFQYSDGNSLQVDFMGKKDRLGSITPETDSFYYAIHEVEEKGYLLQSWGSHGSGQEFTILKMFLNTMDGLEYCTDCFDYKDKIWFERPRLHNDSKIKYDSLTMTIKYPQYKEDSDTGFSKLTGKEIVLKWDGNTFVKQE